MSIAHHEGGISPADASRQFAHLIERTLVVRTS